MHMQLTYYLESNTLMATTQYGYRSDHSTELASLEIIDRIYGHFENNDIPCAVFAIFPQHLSAFHIQYYLTS